MKVIASEKSKKVEKNIYVEVRSGSYRFTVAVYPLEKDTITVSPDEYAAALRWAQKRRLELLAVKAASKAGLCLPGTNNPPQFIPSPLPAPYPVAHSPFALDSQFGPGTIQMQDIFDGYRENELDKLAGKDAQTSRLNQLEGWFGHLTLSQLDYNYVDKWRRQRMSGKLGSGRNPNRGRVPVAQIQTQAERESGEISTDEQQEDEAPKKLLTKHQRYSRKKQAIKDGEKIPEALVFPVSSPVARQLLTFLHI